MSFKTDFFLLLLFCMANDFSVLLDIFTQNFNLFSPLQIEFFFFLLISNDNKHKNIFRKSFFFNSFVVSLSHSP
jgi:hypothetical protein